MVDDELLEMTFSPSMPVATTAMFARRRTRGGADLVQAVRDALRVRGQQVFLHGETGTGKTSLVGQVCREDHLKVIEVSSGPDLNEMLADARASVEPTVPQSRTTRLNAKGSISGSLMGFLKGSAGVDAGVEATDVPANLPPIVQTVAALEGAGVDVFFIDNFEQYPPAQVAQDAVGRLVTYLSGRSSGGHELKVVFAAIPLAGSGLLTSPTGAYGRRITEIEVPRMDTEELTEILSLGEARLGIEFSQSAKAAIVGSSDRLPFWTHSLANRAVKAMMSEDGSATTVQSRHFDAAVLRVIDESRIELAKLYELSVVYAANPSLARAIVEFIARHDPPEVPFPNLIQAVAAGDRSRTETMITDSVLALERDGLLRAIGESERRKYEIARPLMRGYIKLRQIADWLNKRDPDNLAHRTGDPSTWVG